jgi:uncharacterized protein (TIGR02145 family)
MPALLMAQEVHEPGAEAVTFEAFNPVPAAPIGSTWRLTDSRDGNTYMVRKLADGRIWMVQDLRFGHCSDKSFAEGSIARSYKGHCRTNTQPDAGYLYDYTAVAQRDNLCPIGWFVPTSGDYSAADKAFQKVYGCKSYQCWQSESFWAGVPTDFCNAHGVPLYHPGEIAHWTASPYNKDSAYCFVSQPGKASVSVWLMRIYGLPVRCMKNYD